MKKKNIIAVVIIIAVLIIAALIAVLIAVKFTASDIGEEQARNIVLEHAGVSKDIADFTKVKLSDGEYEIEFNTPDGFYEYEISAFDGKIKEYEKKNISGSDNTNIPPETSTAKEEEQTLQETFTAEEKVSQVPVTAENNSSVNTSHNQTHHNTELILSSAYSYAGINSQDVSWHKVDFDDGLYEVEFYAQGYEYECKVAPDGKVVKFEKEKH